MARQAINWERVKQRWIERNLGGEVCTLKQLAADEGLRYDTLKKRARQDGWKAELATSEARISTRVAAQVEIDQVRTRLELAHMGDCAAQLFEIQLERWETWAVQHPDERLPIRDLASLGTLALKLKEAGAGLAKEHKVIHERSDAVSRSIERQRQVEQDCEELAALLRRQDDEKPESVH